MRTLESLLLLTDLLAFVVWAFPPLRAMTWTRQFPAIPPVMAAVQWLAEGARWQLLPAYGLALLFSLVWLLRNVTSAGRSLARQRRHPIAAVVVSGLSAPGLAIAIALPMMVPVFGFAPPSGPDAIGTLAYHWIDAARPDAFAADPNQRRQLMVQVWYPAQADPSAPGAAYVADADAVTAAFARIHGLPAFLLGHFKYVRTNAISAAPAAADRPQYPVLLFVEGATGFRQMNTFQVEHLVSHGYIVVAIDQPGAAAAVVFPDGHVSAGMTVAQFHATVSPSYLPGGSGALHKGVLLPNGRALADDSIVPYLAKDVMFTLDRLHALNQADPNGILTGKLDLHRLGAFGVSLGGIVVGDACRVDPRLRACLMMDAPMSTAVVAAGLQQPAMWITRDAASMRLERQRSGGWPEAEIEAHQTSMRAVYDGLAGDGYFVQVPGMFHSNFTDIAGWTPLIRMLGLAGPIDEQRAHGIVNAYSLAFFDRHLRGRSAKLFDGAARGYPEVRFESRRP